MKHLFKFLIILMVSITAMGGLTSCAKKKSAAVEVEMSEQDLERQRMEEEERRRQAELERLRQEELARQQAEADARMLNFDPTTVLEAVYFDFDKYELKSEARDALSRNAEWISANPGYQIQIEGHCDERGSNEYNLALGERRAMAAKSYLVSLGVSESNLYTISYGEEMPADPGHDASAWAKNRRAQFKVATP